MAEITVAIPTYNGKRFIRQAVVSVLNQARSDFRFLINDDVSTDGTPEALEEFRDSSLEITHNSKRLGLVGNWNRCLELAHGKYIYLFHQDDEMEPGNLQVKLEALERYPQAGLIFSDICTINDNSQVIGGHWDPASLPIREGIYPGQDMFQRLLTHGNFIPCQTVMIRRDVLNQVGIFDSRLRYTPDYAMWLRLSLRSDIVYRSKPLVSLRRHPGQATGQFNGKLAEIQEIWKAITIVFTEDTDLILDRKVAYHLAVDHVMSWTYSILRTTLAGGRLGQAARLSLAWLRLQRCRQAGPQRINFNI